MPTLYPFLSQKSSQLGAEPCSNCGEQDAAFGLGVKGRFSQGSSGGFCIFCGNPVKKYSKAKTFQYCLEVYKEVFINRNDQASPEDKKMADWVINEMLSEMDNGSKLPANDKILKFQTFNIGLGNKSGYPIGSPEKMAGYVVIQGNQVLPSLDEKSIKHKGDAYAIGITCFCISYLLHFEVANEFVLPTEKKKASTTPSTPQYKPTETNKQQDNSGCFGVLALLFVILTTLFFLI
jgi:hypothetical protein